MVDLLPMRPAMLAAALLCAVTATAEAAPRRFALVVGNNHPLPGHGYEPLEYADDDALRFAAFMESLNAQVWLLVGPDRETAARHKGLAERAGVPRRDRLLDAVASLDQALREAEGEPREVYLYFSGHGSVTSSKAYLHLLDAPFTRTDLHASVLERLSAERVHVIIDSCHSYFLVNDRGERVPAQDDRVDLSRYPRAGFLLSTSAKKEVQEWSGYEAGVFSYQLLGAMRGAADVNLDGKVTYAEAHAYLVAANLEVQNPAARVQPFLRRPSVGETVLVDLGDLPVARQLEVPEALEGHFYVVSGRGERVLDANKPAGLPMALAMPPGEDLLLWSGRDAFGVQRGRGRGRFTRSSTVGGTMEVSPRGSVADELRRRLFARPLTPEFVAGLDAAVGFGAQPPSQLVTTPGTGPRPVSIGLWSAGGAAVLAGAIATAVYVEAHGTASPEVFTADNRDAVSSARRRADVARAVMVGGYATGLALAGAGLLYEWLDGSPAPVMLGASPGAVMVGGRW